MSEQQQKPTILTTGAATGILPSRSGRKPITVIGTEAIRSGFDQLCLEQALNSRDAPGVTDLVLNPDAHAGYGAPVGCVLVSPSHVYPGPVGVDIKCSMSLLQTNISASQIEDRVVRREILNAIIERIPTGAGRGQSSAPKSRRVNYELGRQISIEGASRPVCESLGIPTHWAERCEDAFHFGHDDTADSLERRFAHHVSSDENKKRFAVKASQLGSYGGGNHFGECEVVRVEDNERAKKAAEVFGLHDGQVAFLSHCGSRGWGHHLASGQFHALQSKFADWSIPLPGGDKELIYAPLGTREANAYLDDMALGANFATVNHMLINALVLEAFQQVLPETRGELVYFISHNIARREIVQGHPAWVHRKGATRAFPAGHFALKGTRYESTGHPILLPGNPRDGSVVMVADAGAEKSCYSVNHGAGRAMGRREAGRRLDQTTIDKELDEYDILSNCRRYPIDEAPAAYKDFREVLKSVEEAGLASTVATLKARFVLKDADKADD